MFKCNFDRETKKMPRFIELFENLKVQPIKSMRVDACALQFAPVCEHRMGSGGTNC